MSPSAQAPAQTLQNTSATNNTAASIEAPVSKDFAPAAAAIPTSQPNHTQPPTSAPRSIPNSAQASETLSEANHAQLRSYSSSPGQFPTELQSSIPEEACETESEIAEPVTPASHGSQHFHNQEDAIPDLQSGSHAAPEPQTGTPLKPVFTSDTYQAGATSSPLKPTPSESETPPPPPSRRTTFSRAVSSLFKRSSSGLSQQGQGLADSVDHSPSAGTPNPGTPNGNPGTPNGVSSRAGRRFSLNPSSTTTRSNSPPSPTSPLEMTNTKSTVTNGDHLPGPDDFNEKKKNRSSTGLMLKNRAVQFVGGRGGAPPRASRRAASFDAHNEKPELQGPPLPESNWALHPDAGTGTKARRMSVSLPDDFTVEVTDLLTDFESLSKFRRHGRHVGKGAASKVCVMARKGFSSELYAVKEFRGKSKAETKEEYENKIKSEFSIAKSLHHPNIVETVSLCTDHGRWNHVMEYCSEGDLYGLVSKRYLHKADRQDDRLCLFKQMIQGINYLHTHGIAHRDIKLENLLITKDSKLKITDFGVSEVFCGTHPGLREAGGQCGKNMDENRLCSPGICGSMPYIAPEVIEKKHKYDPRALDVWSAGIVVLYLTFGGCIWEKAVTGAGQGNYDALVQGWDKWNGSHEDGATITDDDYPFHKAMNFAIKPPALRRLVIQMLNPDPAKRLTMQDIVNHRWFRNIDCCQLESYEEPTKQFDATKSGGTQKMIRCHNHLPPKNLETTFIGNGRFDE